jgi:nicotinamidase-related amidase
MKTALVIVDVQNDFLPAQGERKDGALAVPEGNEILPIINDLLDRSKWNWDVIIATQVRSPII